ncbi:MAG TPA: SH3 domain-containing protein, partial [Candidatus Eisenbacteria bacterium]|nr:SH3 domain-containing protein [Candidatus Eisenbacteria bacterium]
TVTGLHAVLENGATAPPKLDLAETQPHGSSSAASSNMKQGFRSHGSYPPEADQAGQTSASNTIAADRDDSAAHGQPPPEASFAIHPNGGHGYKVFVAMIPLLLITGTVLAGFLRKQSIEAETAAMSDFSGPNETAGGGPALGAGPTAERRGHPAGTEQPHTGPIFAASYQGESDGAPAADPAQPERARDDRLASDPAGAPSVSNAGNPPGRFWGSYRIVRPTQVHKEPNESSPAVSKLDAGAQVNVVAGADGWLEIRSQDGRPSGFIKSETAARKR